MERKIRLIIFFFFIAAFLITALTGLLYASGWRLDLRNQNLVATGGIFLDPYPEDAVIVLDGTVKKQTSLFSPNAFFDNVLPGRHTVRTVREDSVPWEKTLDVLPRKITEARHILLLPKSPDRIAVASAYDFSGVAVSDDGKNIFAWGENETASSFAITADQTFTVIATDKILPENVVVQEATWFQGALPLLLLRAQKSSAQDEETLWLMLDVTDPLAPLVLPLPAKTHRAHFAPLSFETDMRNIGLLLEVRPAQEGIGLLQFHYLPQERRIAPARQFPYTALAVIPQKDRFLFLDERGVLFAITASGTAVQLTLHPTTVETNENGSPPKEILSVWRLIAHKNIESAIALLDPFGTLLTLDRDQRAFRPIAEGVKDARFSKSGNRILWHTRFELWTGYLSDQKEQPAHEQGDKELLARYLEPIRDAWWYPGGDFHAIFAVGNAIKVAELDGRDHRAITDIFLGTRPRLAVRADKTVLIHDEETLWELVLPMPPRYDLGILGF